MTDHQRFGRRAGMLAFMLIALAGCTHLRVDTNGGACSRDLAAVERAAEVARQQVARGVAAEQRQPTLSQLSDATARARLSGGYQTPDTPSSDRARKPKAG